MLYGLLGRAAGTQPIASRRYLSRPGTLRNESAEDQDRFMTYSRYQSYALNQVLFAKHRPTEPPVSTSVSDPASESPLGDAPVRVTKNSDQAFKRFVIIASAVVLVVVLLIVIQTQGNISGSEFSPTHFQQRDFSFYEIPLIHLQISPIRRSDSSPSTAKFLRMKSLITAPKGKPAYWHLVKISRGIGGTNYADANLLIDQLLLNPDGDLYWKVWTKDHPKLASVLWPIIQKLAERELYILMPRVFEIVQTQQNPDQLQATIDSYLVEQYRELIQDMVAADRPELAKQLLAEAKADYPEDPLWSEILLEAAP